MACEMYSIYAKSVYFLFFSKVEVIRDEDCCVSVKVKNVDIYEREKKKWEFFIWRVLDDFSIFLITKFILNVGDFFGIY